jgi:hypothetical protein
MQFCRILVNRAIIEHILYTNRKRRFYEVFPIASENQGENRSPYRAYFPLMICTLIFQVYPKEDK